MRLRFGVITLKARTCREQRLRGFRPRFRDPAGLETTASRDTGTVKLTSFELVRPAGAR
jgi:hypothetical protein